MLSRHRPEEPYSREDHALLEGVSSGLALFASRRPAPVPADVGPERDAWNAFLARGLAADASDRPASARALAAEFEAALPLQSAAL